jgi:uncharacterized protein (TIGR02284 family)
MENVVKQRNDNLINSLNELVEINNDRIQGYERAIAENEDEELDYLFITMASHSKTNKTDLSREISLLGGEPTESTRTSGKLFRLWMDIKAALTGKNKQEILASCEFGETAAVETYEQVLKEQGQNLNDSFRLLIESQKKEIIQDRDRIRSLLQRSAGS